MAAKIIMFVCCLMCGVPFLIISAYNRSNAITPIVFWSGSEEKLKRELKDIQGYNGEMAAIYQKCAFAFLLAGIGAFIHVAVGMLLLVFDCTIGIYLVFRKYKMILQKFT